MPTFGTSLDVVHFHDAGVAPSPSVLLASTRTNSPRPPPTRVPHLPSLASRSSDNKSELHQAGSKKLTEVLSNSDATFKKIGNTREAAIEASLLVDLLKEANQAVATIVRGLPLSFSLVFFFIFFFFFFSSFLSPFCKTLHGESYG